VRRVQAAAARIPAALDREQSLQPILRVGNLMLWSRSRGAKGARLGKIGISSRQGGSEPPG